MGFIGFIGFIGFRVDSRTGKEIGLDPEKAKSLQASKPPCP